MVDIVNGGQGIPSRAQAVVTLTSPPDYSPLCHEHSIGPQHVFLFWILQQRSKQLSNFYLFSNETVQGTRCILVFGENVSHVVGDFHP